VTYGLDPYAWQKTQGLAAALPAAEQAAGLVRGWLEAPAQNIQEREERLVELLKINLWSNQVDLSLWPAGQADRPDHADVRQGEPFLLCDQAARAAAHLAGSPPGRVDILADNAGQELLLDLLLAAYLLGSGLARQVRLHLKPHPTYVSDATVQDVLISMAALRQSPRPPARAAGLALEGRLAQGRLALSPDYFWTSPYAGWELPSRLRRKLAGSRLVISKGDANYRRLLGDRRWTDEAPFSQVVGYFPAPLLALRVLKSDVVVGLRSGQAEALTARAADWRTSGHWGVIQFNG
jgi:hypothetical protein